MAANLLNDTGTTSPSIRTLPDADISWGTIVRVLVDVLGHDFEAIELEGCAQFGHMRTGIRVTSEHNTVQLSVAYALNVHDAATVAELLREVVMQIELQTGGQAAAVQFAQADLMAAEMAGRTRVHGYVFGHAGGELVLHQSRLHAFDAMARTHNAAD